MKHWTEIDFQHWLYGLKELDSHVEQCQECRSELKRLEQKRRQITAQPKISDEFLASQRRSIYQKLDRPRSHTLAWRWAVSLAMLLFAVFGVTRLHRPAPAISDEQLFSDLAAIEQSAEPRAIQPIHNLFEE